MKYYLDTEFHKYHKPPKVCGIHIGKAIPTIELISIGIVSEDRDAFSKRIGKTDKTFKGREYYAISKDFDIKAAWNSWQVNGFRNNDAGIRQPIKEYWLRENILKPIFDELELKEIGSDKMPKWYKFRTYNPPLKFTYKNFKYLINKYGKSNKQIAEEIKEFTQDIVTGNIIAGDVNLSVFYAYHAGYDWVVFCQLFGKIIDLPEIFPKYCIDLKQELDSKVDKLEAKDLTKLLSDGTFGYTNDNDNNFDFKLEEVKKHKSYPKQDNEHNALLSAKWNKELHKFINKLT